MGLEENNIMSVQHVLYQGKKYTILYQYTSGFCEIQELTNRFNIQLVHVSEIIPVPE